MSCVGAALQTLAGAPRLLAAIAEDDIIPAFRVFKAPPGREPRAALALTWLIASAPCLAGNLDAITPGVTLCFLAMYGTMNMACFLLSYLKEPTWRPVWHNSVPGIRRGTAAVGALLCLALMFFNNPTGAMAMVAGCYALMQVIGSYSAAPDWGDSMHGLRFHHTWTQVLRLQQLGAGEHPKNWKPRLLVFTKCDEGGGLAHSAVQLLNFASQLRKGRGMLLARHVLVGDVLALAAERAAMRKTLQRQLGGYCEGCADVVVARELGDGLVSAVQGAGLGEALSPNSIVVSWPKRAKFARDAGAGEAFMRSLHGWKALNKTVLSVKHPGEWRRTAATSNPTIDLWWVLHDGGHPLMIAYLLRRHAVWSSCRLRIFALQPSGDEGEPLANELKQALLDLRISADSVEVVHVRCTAPELGAFFGGVSVLLPACCCLLLLPAAACCCCCCCCCCASAAHHLPCPLALVAAAEERFVGDGIRLGRRGRNRARSVVSSGYGGGGMPIKLTPAIRTKVVSELHEKIIEHQGQLSSLVVISLPTLAPGVGVGGTDALSFIDAMEALTAQLDHVLFVHGSEEHLLTAEG